MSFHDWFEKQVGRRPSSIPTSELRSRIKQAEYELKALQAELDAVWLWDEKRTVALYAWQAVSARKEKGK